MLPKLQEKVQCVREERKLNFGNEITEIIVLPKLYQWMNCGNKVVKNEGKKNATFTTFLQQIRGS